MVDAIGVYLRNAGFEAPHVVYAFMKPLLIALPSTARGGDANRFASRLLASMWAATDADDWRTETESLMLQCYAECLPILASMVAESNSTSSSSSSTSTTAAPASSNAPTVAERRSKFMLESIGYVVRAAFADKCTAAQWTARSKIIVECINQERIVVAKSSDITCGMLRWLAQQYLSGNLHALFTF